MLPRCLCLCVVLPLSGGIALALLLRCLPRSSLRLLRCVCCVALAGLCPWCFQSLGVYSVLACGLAGQFALGTLMVVRGFFNDGMFVLEWICQVVALEFWRLLSCATIFHLSQEWKGKVRTLGNTQTYNILIKRRDSASCGASII